MKRNHKNVYELAQLAGLIVWVAIDDNGMIDCDMEVIPVSHDTFVLIDADGDVSYWQNHGEAAYHSDTLSEMSDWAQYHILDAQEDIAKDNRNFVLSFN